MLLRNTEIEISGGKKKKRVKKSVPQKCWNWDWGRMR